jgi:hypothetical protein
VVSREKALFLVFFCTCSPDQIFPGRSRRRKYIKENWIMKKVWKWILGIVLGLVVLAVLVGVVFMVRSNFHGYRAGIETGPGFHQRGPEMMPYGGFEHLRRPGMPGYRMMLFGGFFRGLFSLGFLAFVVLGIIWLVRRLNKPAAMTATPLAAMAEPVPVVTPEPMQATIVNPCKKCGKPLQDGWKVCPHCGKKV